MEGIDPKTDLQYLQTGRGQSKANHGSRNYSYPSCALDSAGERVLMVMVDAHECVSGMLSASLSTWPECILTWVLQLCQQTMVKHLFRYKVLHTCELAPSVR